MQTEERHMPHPFPHATWRSVRLLPLVLLFLLPLLVHGDTLSAAKVADALDAPQGIVFSSCTGASLLAKYSNPNIGNEDETGTGTVLPVAGGNFLQLTGSSSPLLKPRSGRIKAAFSFQVKGAGTLTFQHRVATEGSYDDCLVFYEGNIDDENAELLSIGGDYWGKMEKDEDGNRWYEVNDYSFWNEESLFFSADAYSRTIQVALLAPKPDDFYDPKEESEKRAENDIQTKAWLDAFVWEPDKSAILCDILPESGTSFGANGILAYLSTDYQDSEGTPLLTFRYTLDGSTPTEKSPLYNDQEGIPVNRTCRLRVGVFEGSTLISNDIYADYSLREPLPPPRLQVSPGDPFVTGAEIHFYPAEPVAYPLDYRYTTDGSTPTADSPSGTTISLNAPCTLKVRAYDDGTLGEVATFTATRAPAPVVYRLLDEEGNPAPNGVFLERADLFLASSSLPPEGEWAIYFRAAGSTPLPAGSPIIVDDDATVEFLLHRKEKTASALFSDGQSFLMDSESRSCTLWKAQEEDGQWLLSQLSSTGWNLVGIPRGLPVQQQREILAWLKPIAYSPVQKIYRQATDLAPGNCYWVYLSNGELPEEGRPTAFYSREIPATTTGEPTSQWRLTDKDALYFFDGGAFQKAPAPPNELPGWTNAQ